jgi:alkyl hydroperoxide reductase subunit AhpC
MWGAPSSYPEMGHFRVGGLPYPELSDFHPKGQATKAYDLWNPERGANHRAVIIVDKDGFIRYRKTYAPSS